MAIDGLSSMVEGSLKRFYEAAIAVTVGDQWGIELDGRSVRTPGGRPLVVSSEVLAGTIAQEWSAQGDTIDLNTMPMCGFANAAIDRVAVEQVVFVEQLGRFVDSDLVCYWSDEPADLRARQEQAWQPLLEWAAGEFGFHLRVTSGISHVGQPAETIEGVKTFARGLSAMELVALTHMATTLSSVIIAFAIFQHRVTPEDGFEASLVDEMYQMEKWGDDNEARDRRNSLRSEILDAAHFLSLLRA